MEQQQQMEEGAILTRSWGYDQTNVDFYVVIRRTETMAIIQPIVKEFVGKKGEYHDLVSPVLREGEPIVKGVDIGSLRRKVLEYDGKPFLSYANWAGAGVITVWDGSPQIQTAAGFGH